MVRRAVKIISAVAAVGVVFKITLIRQVVANQAQTDAVGRRVLHIGMPQGVAALLEVGLVVQVTGAALHVHTCADTPSVRGTGQPVIGVEPEDTARRVLAVSLPCLVVFVIIVVFAVVVGVAGKQFPKIGRAHV